MKRIWGLCGKIADFFGDIYGKAVVGFVLFLGLKTPLQKTSFVLKW